MITKNDRDLDNLDKATKLLDEAVRCLDDLSQKDDIEQQEISAAFYVISELSKDLQKLYKQSCGQQPKVQTR